MIDAAAAEQIVRAWIAQLRTAPPMQLELRTERTEEHPFGWVFHYGKPGVPLNPSLNDILFGAAPVIVDRLDGSVHPLPSGLPASACIDIYARTRQLPKLPLRVPLGHADKREP